jgi:hypothetical protein
MVGTKGGALGHQQGPAAALQCRGVLGSNSGLLATYSRPPLARVKARLGS